MKVNTVLGYLGKLDELCNKNLLSSSYVEENKLKSILSEKRQNSLEKYKDTISGTLYYIDIFEKKLILFDYANQKLINSFDLPGFPPAYDKKDWVNWGTSSYVLDNDSFQKVEDFKNVPTLNYGLLVRNDGSSILYHPDLEYQKYFGLSKSYLYGAITNRPTTFLPYELYLSSDNVLLCISNREEGKVYLFNTQLMEFEAEIQVRSHADSNKAINIAISTLENVIYITDNETSNLGIYGISAKRYSKRSLGDVPLSNLVISPYEDSLYIIFRENEPVLRQISLERYDLMKEFSLKGKLFSEVNAPCDLMTFSPDNKNIYLVTYLDEPEPLTPVITVIDFDKNKAIKRYSVKDSTTPVNLVFSEENKLYESFKNINDMSLENRWISNEMYEKVKVDSEEDLKLLETSLELSEEEQEFLEIEPEPYLLEATIKDDQQELNIKPTRQKHIVISPEANKYIIELIVGVFWDKTSIDLTEIKEMQSIIKNMALITRKNLEFYDIDVIRKELFYQEHSLALIVQRSYILEMLAEEESRVREEIETCPTNCINCKSPLMGSWICQVCGIELEKPENILRKKEASLISNSNLQSNHFWGLDYQKATLYEFDKYNVCIGKINKDSSIIESIDNFYRLETNNTIIFDKKKQNILEISSRGRVVRKYVSKAKETALVDINYIAPLNNRNLLVASKNRIFETNFVGKLVWEYKKDLINPICIQKTVDSTYLIVDDSKNRVFELTKVISEDKLDFNIIWEYNKDNFNPYYAYKDYESNVTILDSKNSKIIVLDSNSKIKWEFNTLFCGIENPIGVIKLKNQDLIIYNKTRISCIMPLEQNKIKFTYNIEDLAKRNYSYLISSEESETFKAAELAKRKNARINSLKESEELLNKILNKDNLKENKKVVKKESNIEEKKQSNEETKVETELVEVEPPQKKQIHKKFSIEEIKALMKNRDKENNSNNEISEKNTEVEYDPSRSRIVITPGANVMPISLPIVDNINNKAFIINRSGDIIWEFKDDNIHNINDATMTPNRSVIISSYSGLFEVDIKSKRTLFKYLNPCSGSSKLRNGNYLICDNSKKAVIEIDRAENNIWSYYHEKEEPSTALRLPNGNTLITYSKVNCIKEVNNQGKVIRFWGFSLGGKDELSLLNPSNVFKTSSDSIIISDKENSRVIEVSNEGKIILEFKGNELGDIIEPTKVIRLKNGNTIVYHSNNRKIFEFDSNKKYSWQWFADL